MMHSSKIEIQFNILENLLQVFKAVQYEFALFVYLAYIFCTSHLADNCAYGPPDNIACAPLAKVIDVVILLSVILFEIQSGGRVFCRQDTQTAADWIKAGKAAVSGVADTTLSLWLPSGNDQRMQ